MIDATHEIIKHYRSILLKLGLKADAMDADDLKEYLASYSKQSGVDFLPFIESYIDELIRKGKKDFARSYVTVKNSLVDFFGERRISPSDITYNFLLKWWGFCQKWPPFFTSKWPPLTLQTGHLISLKSDHLADFKGF